jgi:hypothetical protein
MVWRPKGMDCFDLMFQPARRVQNIVPITVRQILESREDGLKIGSMDVHMVRKSTKNEMMFV